MSRRTFRLVVVSYVVKSVLLVLLWVLAPEIPAKALGHARTAWTCVMAWVAPSGG
ncbi:MAG TPA: hypothetical protein VMV21_12305 [Vicinamibacteria bacterium]|nr:hypothetical protein [Vicinamibacteria bacterium]